MTIDAPKIMFYTQDSWQQAAVRDPVQSWPEDTLWEMWKFWRIIALGSKSCRALSRCKRAVHIETSDRITDCNSSRSSSDSSVAYD